MVRLMLTLTPVVCVLSGIALSLIFDFHLQEEGRGDTDLVTDRGRSSDKVYTNNKIEIESSSSTFLLFVYYYYY